MNSAPFDRVYEVFSAALAQAADQRAAYLDRVCDGDGELRQEVEKLLDSQRRANERDFLEPAADTSEEAADPLVGSTVGHYRIERRIGAGGMGRVYQGVRTSDYRQQVAIKVINFGGASEQARVRLRSEMQLLAAVEKHPNIASLLDAGTTDDGRPHFVMEYVDGIPIDAYCCRHRLGLVERLRLFGAVCGAVQFAHQNAVIHRDLKPSNILVASDGTAKLIDFGIAKLSPPQAAGRDQELTQTEQRALTLNYASPEQIRGEAITTASDVYSLGVILYELLTGEGPYALDSENYLDASRVVCEQRPARPSSTVRSQPSPDAAATPRQLAGDLDNIVMMALRKEPQRRYASVDQLSRDVTRYLEGLPVRATADTFRYRAGKFLRRNKLAVAATAAIVAAIIVGTLGTVTAGIRASRNAARAEAAAEQARHEAARANLEADASERVTTLLAELYESAAPNSMGGFRLGIPRGLAPDLESQRELSAQNARSIVDELAAKPALQARLLDAIANTYVGMGRIDDAAPLLEESRKIVAADPDASDADVARNLRSFGWLRFMQGRYGEALGPAREVLAIHRAQLGENAEETLQSKLHLAILLAILETRHNEAEALTNEVIQARRESLGPDHPLVGFALLAKVLVHASAQQNARALGPGLEAARIFSAHPETSGLAQGITGIANSVVQSRLGNNQAALDLARASLERIREVLGDDHPIVANQALYTRRVMEETGDGEQAKKLYREAIDQLRNRQKEPGYLYARNIERLGLIAKKAQQNDEAEAHLREALAIYRRSLCEDSWRVGWTLAQLGIVLRQAGRYEEAIATLHEAIDIFQRVAAHSPLNTVAWCQLRLDDTIRQLAASKQ